jgi:hypothetical protein
MRLRNWYPWLGVAAALAMVTVLLALPSPRRPGVGSDASPGTSLATLAAVWPSAKSYPIPAVLPDGSSYRPRRILDPTTSVGTADSADGKSTALVVVAGDRTRVLQSELVDHAALFQGVVATVDRLFWMLTSTDATGHPVVGLWGAARADGAAALVTTDVGLPLMLGSTYDLEVVADRLYWTATPPGGDRTELRSVPLGGGQVSVATIPGTWAMSAWPWLVTAPSAAGAPMRLYDTAFRTTVTVPAPAHQQIACSPVWCRVVPLDAGTGRTQLLRPNGSDVRDVGPAGALPVCADVAVRDRFEPMLIPPGASGPDARLVLHDLTATRDVLVATLVTNAYADADHLWWSTGDNETLSWYGLDLRTLS